jgi:sarcosine oxidase subunit beta
VSLFEQAYWASGPTGRSSANVRLFYLTDEMAEIARRSQAVYRDFTRVTGGDAGYRQTGIVYAPAPEEVAPWRVQVERLAARGFEIEAQRSVALRQLLPGFDLADLDTLIYEPLAGYADPVGVTTGFAEGARRLGATVRPNTRVRALVARGGRVEGLELADGAMIGCDVVVVAAGPWTGALVEPLGVSLPLHVERHPIALLDAPAQARSLMPVIWSDNRHAYYARPEGSDVIVVGTQEPMPALPSFDRYDEGVSTDEAAELVGRLARRVPSMAELGLRPGYASVYDVSADSLPIVGAVPGIAGLFVSAGSSGTGFKLAPELGDQIARLITGGEADLLAPLRVDRPLRRDTLMHA